MIDINQFRADHLIKIPLGFLELIKVKLLYAFHHSPFLSLPFIIIVFAVLIFLYVFRKIWNIKVLLLQNPVFLELTPPAFSEKTAYTTQQLFSVLHHLGMQRTFFEKILGKKVLFSFEIVSTKEQGIRYLIKTTSEESEIIERTIMSYLPQVRVKRVNEYLPERKRMTQGKIIEFKLRKHFAFPLANQQTLSQHDPVAYITGMMTKLQPGELIAMQIVASPKKTNEAEILSQKILRNEDILEYLNKPQIPIYILPFILLFKGIFKLVHVVTKELGWALTELYHGSSPQQKYVYSYMNHQDQLIARHLRPERILSTFEQETIAGIQKKVDQELFETSIRTIIRIKDSYERRERIKGIKSSLAPFSVPKYQSLRALYNFPPIISYKLRLFTFQHRLLSLFSNSTSSLLSVSEIADLYHFPYQNTTQTENIVKSLSRELPAPLSLKQGDNLDVVFAENSYAGITTKIGLTTEERRRHVYIIGATGSGKSTLLLTSIKSDIDNGKGFCVIDPHGELAESVIACISKKRKPDFVYINPDDLTRPLHINLLELTPGLSEEDSLREKEFIAESVISLFRKVFSDAWAKSAHRIEYILRNTIHTAFELENPTLFTLYDLLNDEDFRKQALLKLTDERLKKFWKNEFGKAGDMQRVKMNAGITSKIGRFLFSPSAKRLLEHEKSTINFDELINSGKIVVCNLSKGKLSEDTSEVLGVLILTKIQLAALKRAKIPANQRRDFYVYVDECQTFITPFFVQMLSEARKYKVDLIMAEQSTSQQKDKNLVHIIIANVGTVICFRTANPEDEKLMLNYFSPYINKGEIINLPAFNFYIKISAVHPEEPFSGRTILVELPKNNRLVNELIEYSRQKYGILYVKKEVKNTKDSKSNQPKDTKKIESKTNRKTGAPDDDEEE